MMVRGLSFLLGPYLASILYSAGRSIGNLVLVLGQGENVYNSESPLIQADD